MGEGAELGGRRKGERRGGENGDEEERSGFLVLLQSVHGRRKRKAWAPLFRFPPPMKLSTIGSPCKLWAWEPHELLLPSPKYLDTPALLRALHVVKPPSQKKSTLDPHKPG